MSKRVNIILPDTTLKVLDRVAGKGDRSRFISEAVLHYVRTRGAANLRERLKQGALANAKLDLEIAEGERSRQVHADEVRSEGRLHQR